jgi:hypothetical protein
MRRVPRFSSCCMLHRVPRSDRLEVGEDGTSSFYQLRIGSAGTNGRSGTFQGESILKV